jgi:excisionase family DNA binding protein
MLSFFKKKEKFGISQNNRLSLQPTYVTTSEFAKVCNLSRFTVINWVNQRKIRSVKTLGKHRRIPLSELLTFLESRSVDLSTEKKTQGHDDYCWECALKQKNADKCKTCALYGSQFHYCAVLATSLGKEKIQCAGDCLSCHYWNEFSSSGEEADLIAKNSEAREFIKEDSNKSNAKVVKLVKQSKKEGNFFSKFSFNMGQGVHGIRNILPFRNTGNNEHAKK